MRPKDLIVKTREVIAASRPGSPPVAPAALAGEPGSRSGRGAGEPVPAYPRRDVPDTYRMARRRVSEDRQRAAAIQGGLRHRTG